MIKINFPNLHEVVTFDGEVLEVFHGDRSQRIHVAHIESILINTDRNENHQLRVDTYGGAYVSLPFNEELLPKVDELVTEVQKAKATFKL